MAAFATTVQAASLVVGFQQTIASEGNALARRENGNPAEGGPYYVSVNPNNAGYASFAANLPGTSTAAPAFQRAFTQDVQGYAWVGGANNVLTVLSSRESGGLINYTTTDTTFDGFAQDQLTLWTTNDPGSDLLNPLTARNFVGPGYRSFGDVTATIDISELASGTVNIFYGSFSATPTVSAVMRDSSGVAPDIAIANAHLNGDFANRAEYYVAELDFVTDGIYDEIVYTWLANGVNNTGNGRFGGTVLTGTLIPEPSSSALLGLGVLGLLLRRRRK